LEDITPRVVEIANIIPAAATPVAPAATHPAAEPYLPLLYILSLQEKNEPVKFFADRVTLGSLSMRSLWIQ
jgi:aromatic ring-opening dioxygenase catalytic subunit (LigB family)